MNPLKGLMGGGMNPMSMMQSMMGGNPQQMLMNMLQQRNPQGYQQLQQMMQSGQDPNKIAQQMMAQMSPQQQAQIEQMAKQFGINNR